MSFHLVSHKLCPFAQRAVILLEEKGASYELDAIDLSNKPAWFPALSPLGKVPLLRVGDEALFESAVICEYLDEVTEGTIHPADPFQKARHRAWVEYLSGFGVLLMKFTGAPDRAAAQALHDRLAVLEGVVGAGPYFDGEFCMVDAAAASFLQRMTWCAEVGPGEGIFEGLPKVAAWRDALLARPSVQASLAPEVPSMFRGRLRKAVAGPQA